MAKVVQMSQRMRESTRVRLCVPHVWRLERIENRPPRYLVTLRCLDGHLHHASAVESYTAAREEIRRWMAETYPPDYPRPLIADVARGRLIQSSGREWPLAEEDRRG